MSKVGAVVFVALAMQSGGKSQVAQPASESRAVAVMKNTAGRELGRVTFIQTPGGVLISADLSELPAGAHAFHLHAVGTCVPPFESAGPHFNPGGKRHGFKNTAGPHAGDMVNVHVPADGRLRVEMSSTSFTLAAGANSVFDKDGTALLIHAHPDDYVSDPAGEAGPRLACGVIEKQR